MTVDSRHIDYLSFKTSQNRVLWRCSTDILSHLCSYGTFVPLASQVKWLSNVCEALSVSHSLPVDITYVFLLARTSAWCRHLYMPSTVINTQWSKCRITITIAHYSHCGTETAPKLHCSEGKEVPNMFPNAPAACCTTVHNLLHHPWVLHQITSLGYQICWHWWHDLVGRFGILICLWLSAINWNAMGHDSLELSFS